MGSFNPQVKVGLMALTPLSKSKSANIGTDFFQKVMGYQMYGTYARFSRYSPSLSSPSLPIVSAVSTITSLVLVTVVEVANTDTSFLALFLDSGDICLNNISSNSR